MCTTSVGSAAQVRLPQACVCGVHPRRVRQQSLRDPAHRPKDAIGYEVPPHCVRKYLLTRFTELIATHRSLRPLQPSRPSRRARTDLPARLAVCSYRRIAGSVLCAVDAAKNHGHFLGARETPAKGAGRSARPSNRLLPARYAHPIRGAGAQAAVGAPHRLAGASPRQTRGSRMGCKLFRRWAIT